MKNDHTYFKNTACKYFPCHKTDGKIFNCMFCYCPLYAMGENCGGDFAYTEDGIKDCSNCLVPHGENGYTHIISKLSDVFRMSETICCEDNVLK